MASLDVDQKYLGRIAAATKDTNPLVSKSLYQILGLSVILSKKLFRARKLRKLDTSRDTKSLQLYHHIIWLGREGLSILEVCVLPYTQNGEQGPECQVIASKLRASFYHIFCLFHNNPPITSAGAQKGSASGTPTPLSPRLENLQRRTRSTSGGSQRDSTPKRTSRDSKGKKPLLRDPIDSITSDASFLTNPYAGIQPGTTPPRLTPQLPPGLAPIPPKPSAFLLPAIDFIPLTSAHFRAATNTAAATLPGAHPLRLSVAIEHAAFLWDCVHDHEGSRQIARRAIRALQEGEEEGVTDEAFDDAAEMVGMLGQRMRRKSWEGTPRTGPESTPSIGEPSPAPPKTIKEYSLPPVSAPPPSVPIPTTPRKIHVRRDSENPPSLEGGPVGGTPRSPTRTPTGERRGSKGSGSHSHKRSGSRSTKETVTPRDRPAKERKNSNDTTPPSVPRKDATNVTPGSYQSAPSRTPPTIQRKAIETPPRPPPKDYPRTTPSTSRVPSKQTTPSQRVPSQQTTPKSKASRDRRPSTSSGSRRKDTYPQPMEVSPPRSEQHQQGGPVQPIYPSTIQPVPQDEDGYSNGHRNGHQNGHQNGNGAQVDYIGGYQNGVDQGGFYTSEDEDAGGGRSGQNRNR